MYNIYNIVLISGLQMLDQIFNILLQLQMFIGAMCACILDNTVGGEDLIFTCIFVMGSKSRKCREEVKKTFQKTF